MFRLEKRSLFLISGFTWAFIGILLLKKGIYFLMGNQENILNEMQFKPLLGAVVPYFRSFELAALFLVFIGLFIGYFKGKFVLGKSARRVMARIETKEAPIALSHAYSAKYLILIGFMVFLGFSMSYFKVPTDIRGFIDVAVGSALINGSLFYFKPAFGSH